MGLSPFSTYCSRATSEPLIHVYLFRNMNLYNGNSRVPLFQSISVCSYLPLMKTIFPLRLSFRQFSFHPCLLLFILPLSRDLITNQLVTFSTCYTPRPVSFSDKLSDEGALWFFPSVCKYRIYL